MHIFDYSDALQEHQSLTYLKEGDASAWFERPGRCPYCSIDGQVTLHDNSRNEDGDDSASLRYDSREVYSCNCGWWDIVYDEWTGHDSVDPVFEWRTIIHGILRKYDIAGLDVPMDALRRAAERRSILLHDLHPRKMEQLVGSVLADFFPGCEVYHCGRSHDRGIDLIMVESDVPVAIQVKRRESPAHTEPVNAVREFLGAVLLAGLGDCIYVTTADHFSRPAINAAAAALKKNLVQRFELFDRDRFAKMLRKTSNQLRNPWEKHLPKLQWK